MTWAPKLGSPVATATEDKVMKGCLVKVYFQDEGKGLEASARTQVYLSKTKLSSTGGYLAVYYNRGQ